MMTHVPATSFERPTLLDAQIEFILSHPDMSDWIKQTLRGALDCSPVDILNDLEILNRILRARSEAMLSGVCR